MISEIRRLRQLRKAWTLIAELLGVSWSAFDRWKKEQPAEEWLRPLRPRQLSRSEGHIEFNEEMQEAIRRYRAERRSWLAIAEIVGVARGTLWAWRKRQVQEDWIVRPFHFRTITQEVLEVVRVSKLTNTMLGLKLGRSEGSIKTMKTRLRQGKYDER